MAVAREGHDTGHADDDLAIGELRDGVAEIVHSLEKNRTRCLEEEVGVTQREFRRDGVQVLAPTDVAGGIGRDQLGQTRKQQQYEFHWDR